MYLMTSANSRRDPGQYFAILNAGCIREHLDVLPWNPVPNKLSQAIQIPSHKTTS